jgi:hypothetical protein
MPLVLRGIAAWWRLRDRDDLLEAHARSVLAAAVDRMVAYRAAAQKAASMITRPSPTGSTVKRFGPSHPSYSDGSTFLQPSPGEASGTSNHLLTFSTDERHLSVMRSDRPALLPVFRSQHQAELLMGRNRLVRANTPHPAAKALIELLEVTFGPRTVVAEEFAIPKSEQVIILGSWAARYTGEAGPPPRDIDVVVVGTVGRADVYEAADRTQCPIGYRGQP